MTIFGLSVESFISLVNWIAITVAGVVGAVAVRHGRSQSAEKTAPAAKATTVEIAGALVDSSSIRQLMNAVEAKTLESVAARQDAEKTRYVGRSLVDATKELGDQVEELRRVMQDMSNQIARSR